MAIHTIAEQTDLETVFMSLMPKRAADLEVKKDFDTGAVKLTADGKTQYLTGLKALRVENGQMTRELKNVSVSVLNPVDLKPGVAYVPTGKLTITPYITQTKQQGFSYIAESLKPVKTGGEG